MTPYTLNTHSIHYRLASYYGGLSTYIRSTTTCEYAKSLMQGCFIVALITAVGGLGATVVGDTGAWIVAMIVTQTQITPTIFAFFGMFFGLLMSGVLTMEAIVTRSIKRARQVRESEKRAGPGFTEPVHSPIKDKVCTPLRIADGKQE